MLWDEWLSGLVFWVSLTWNLTIYHSLLTRHTQKLIFSKSVSRYQHFRQKTLKKHSSVIHTESFLVWLQRKSIRKTKYSISSRISLKTIDDVIFPSFLKKKLLQTSTFGKGKTLATHCLPTFLLLLIFDCMIFVVTQKEGRSWWQYFMNLMKNVGRKKGKRKEWN